MNAPIYQVTKFTLNAGASYTLSADALVSFTFNFNSGSSFVFQLSYRTPSMSSFQVFGVGSGTADFTNGLRGNPVAQGFFPSGTQFQASSGSGNNWSVTVLFIGG